MNLEQLSGSRKPTGQSKNHMDWLRRVTYRTRQFWQALQARPNAAQLADAQATLTESEYELFCRMQPGEQWHSLQAMYQLKALGHAQPELLAAALLHDVGKTRYPLRSWERAMIVLVRAVLPKAAIKWSRVETGHLGWRKAFVVAERHPAWGAEMAAQAGSPALTVGLIGRHAERPAGFHIGSTEEDRLLVLLQAVDDLN